MRRLRLLVVIVLLLPASRGGAAQLRFDLDPVRSTITVDAATTLTFSLGAGIVGFGARQIPVRAPTTGIGGVLPSGAPSNGLTSSIGGFFVADVSEAPTTIEFVTGLARLTIGTSGSWLPGPPLATATPTAADLAVEFHDATLAWTAALALRDLLGAIDSPGAVALTPAGADLWSFAAGCDFGACTAFSLSAGLVDIDADRLPGTRMGLRFPSPVSSSSVATGQLRRTGSGFEVVIPISVDLVLGPGDLDNPLTQSVALSLSGELVAVPEPDVHLQLLMAGVALWVVTLLARRRTRSLRPLLIVGVVAMGALQLGCVIEKPADTAKPDATAVTVSCDSQGVTTTKNGGLPIGNFTSPDCNPDNFNGFIGEGAELKSFQTATDCAIAKDGMRANARASVTVNLAGSTAPNTLENRQRCFQTLGFPSVNAGNLYLIVSVVTLNLGAAVGEAQPTGTVTVNAGSGPISVPLGGADTQVSLGHSGGTASIELDLRANRTLGGRGAQAMFAKFRFAEPSCLHNYECATASPATPFCGGESCHDGGAGDPCVDASSCDYEGHGMLCDPGTRTCQASGL
jgi:hypothetical protein